MPVMSRKEAEAFLTRKDLDRLMKLVEAEQLAGTATAVPTITFRGKEIRLFDVIELLGKLEASQ